MSRSTGADAVLTDAMLARAVKAMPAPTRTDLRAGAHPDVQMVAGVGCYELDVLIRVQDGGRIDIVGQVTGRERVHEPVARLGVVLYDAEAMRSVAQVETDPFGEFELSGLPEGRYVLALGTTREAPCALIWEGARHAADCQAAV